ncbi:MAG: MAG4270 family putative restriction endonuclease [Candidatus Altimarinota bacterium]
MKILQIPFISKPKAQILTKGIAKYVINKNGEIIDEWCEILEGSQIQGKQKYGSKFDIKIINFRKSLMIDDSKTQTLSKMQLETLNQYFYKNLKTVLNHDKFITGSNPSGSDFDLKRTPYIIYGGKYNQYLFLNFFKKFRKKEKNYTRRNDFETLSLEEYFKSFPQMHKNFLDFNKILFTALESEELNNETYSIDNSSIGKEIINFILSPNYKIEIQDEKQKNDLRIGKLRRIFKNRLRGIKPTDHLFGKYPEDMCEAAHIFPVSEIKKLDLKYWYMIADENNGVNIPTQFHKLYDSNKIYFDEKSGEVCFRNEEYKKYLKDFFSQNEYKIIENILNNERLGYIKMYNKNFVYKS